MTYLALHGQDLILLSWVCPVMPGRASRIDFCRQACMYACMYYSTSSRVQLWDKQRDVLGLSTDDYVIVSASVTALGGAFTFSQGVASRFHELVYPPLAESSPQSVGCERLASVSG